MSKKISFIAVMILYPIGSKLMLENDDPGTVREVYGFSCNKRASYIEFLDGHRLNIQNIKQIQEVV